MNTMLNSVSFQVASFALTAALLFGLATFYPTALTPVELHAARNPPPVVLYLAPT
jgi:hypothetical protein